MKQSIKKLEVAVSGGGTKPKVPNKANKQITSRVENSVDTKSNKDYKEIIDILFENNISPDSLLNEYRRNMILLDIQTEVICEIPKQKELTDILEVESVKNTFATMSETIMIALKADNEKTLSNALNSILSMAKSIINLFSKKISQRYMSNMESYIKNLGNKIAEENWIVDSKND